MRIPTCVCMAPALALSLLLAGCGGGGGSSSLSSAQSFGVVSGTTPTSQVVEFTNPLGESATVRAESSGTHFQVDPASVPATQVAPGETVLLPVIFTPTGAGESTESTLVAFLGGTDAARVLVPLHANAETVTLELIGPPPGFGAVAFGQSVTRSFTLTNRSRLSDVTFSQVSLPNADFTWVAPALPFTVRPDERIVATVRYAPWQQLGAITGDLVLRANHPQGLLRVPVTATGNGGAASVPLGLIPLTGGSTGILQFQVPPTVHSLSVEAVDPGVDYDTAEVVRWFNGLLPTVDGRQLELRRLQGPGGRDYLAYAASQSPFPIRAPGIVHHTLPFSDRPEFQLVAGGGLYEVEFGLLNPPGDASVEVRVLFKASAGGQTPATGTLDLNVWLPSSLGTPAATAGADAALQLALTNTGAILLNAGISLGQIRYIDWDDSTLPSTFLMGRIEQESRRLPTSGGGVHAALNLFIAPAEGGHTAARPGTIRPDTVTSWAFAGWQSLLGRDIEIARQLAGYLGLGGAQVDPIADTPAGVANLMNGGALVSKALTPGQGFVLRNHPLVRHP